jgi:cyanophycinase
MRLVFVVLGLFIIVCPSRAQGKLFIIGGGSRPPDLIERMISESGMKAGYAIILPMSSASDSAVYYANVQFKERNLNNVYGVNFKKGEVASAAKLDSIKNAKLIYITGGDQNRFMDIVGGTDIERAIHHAYKNGSTIAGTSAGAAVMSKLMITGNELKHPDYNSTFKSIESENIEIKSGLGLIEGAIIDQHFLRRSRHNRLISAVIEYPDQIGIGIDEATALLVIGKNCEVIGAAQVIVLKNQSKSKTMKNDKLGAKGLTMDVYLPGEKFTLK